VATDSEVVAGTDVRALIQRLCREATESLSGLDEAANVLRDLEDVDDPAGGAGLDGVLETVRRCSADLEDRIVRLAPHTTSPIADVADELTDAAETLATRWGGLVASRRHAVINVLFAQRSALEDLLGRMARAASIEQPETAPSGLRPTPPPKPRAPTRDPGKAWDAWSQEPSKAGPRELFMELSRSWIEGTGAQLVRDERRSAASVCSNTTEATARVRHHLALLAHAGEVTYMDALAIARQRVVEEMHGSSRAAGEDPSDQRRASTASSPLKSNS
jgi:hypothetical protein